MNLKNILVGLENLKGKGIKLIRADISCVEGEYIRHDANALAKTIIELICNELKFRDKQNDEQYLLLNSKLKEAKKVGKKKKTKKVANKHIARHKKTSKFVNKYSERIKSIQESEQTRQQNIKNEEQKEKLMNKNNKK